MLDYHVHLWPHSDHAVSGDLGHDRIAKYCAAAAVARVESIAITEHLFRFVQGRDLVKDFWEQRAPASLRAGMAAYFSHHATVDLDRYVEVIEQAKADGLPVVLGLEVDYYPGQMDEIREFLARYPFDVILGSVHWLGNWRFDHLEDRESLEYWHSDEIDNVWRSYTHAIGDLADADVCDVLAHVDLIKIAGFVPHAETMLECDEAIVNAASRNSLTIEVSSAGWRKPVAEAYPSRRLLEMARQREVGIVTASDSHSAQGIGEGFDQLSNLVRAAGYETVRSFHSRKSSDVRIEDRPPSDGPSR